jgi:hypothetical protein
LKRVCQKHFPTVFEVFFQKNPFCCLQTKSLVLDKKKYGLDPLFARFFETLDVNKYKIETDNRK